MFILKVNGAEIFRNKSLELVMSYIPEYNSDSVHTEVWMEVEQKQKPYRKNGRVRNGGYVCKQLRRYINSPVGTTSIEFNLSRKEREQYEQSKSA